MTSCSDFRRAGSTPTATRLARRGAARPTLAPAACRMTSRTIGDALLEPHRSYLDDVRALRRGASGHRRRRRCPGPHHRWRLGRQRATDPARRHGGRGRHRLVAVPAIFSVIQQRGDIADEEMVRTFNVGIGMTAVVPPSATDVALTVDPGRVSHRDRWSRSRPASRASASHEAGRPRLGTRLQSRGHSGERYRCDRRDQQPPGHPRPRGGCQVWGRFGRPPSRGLRRSRPARRGDRDHAHQGRCRARGPRRLRPAAAPHVLRRLRWSHDQHPPQPAPGAWRRRDDWSGRAPGGARRGRSARPA